VGLMFLAMLYDLIRKQFTRLVVNEQEKLC